MFDVRASLLPFDSRLTNLTGAERQGAARARNKAFGDQDPLLRPWLEHGCGSDVPVGSFVPDDGEANRPLLRRRTNVRSFFSSLLPR